MSRPNTTPPRAEDCRCEPDADVCAPCALAACQPVRSACRHCPQVVEWVPEQGAWRHADVPRHGSAWCSFVAGAPSTMAAPAGPVPSVLT